VLPYPCRKANNLNLSRSVCLNLTSGTGGHLTRSSGTPKTKRRQLNSTPAVEPLLQAVPLLGYPLGRFQLRQEPLLVRRRLASGLVGSLQLAAKILRLSVVQARATLVVRVVRCCRFLVRVADFWFALQIFGSRCSRRQTARSMLPPNSRRSCWRGHRWQKRTKKADSRRTKILRFLFHDIFS